MKGEILTEIEVLVLEFPLFLFSDFLKNVLFLTIRAKIIFISVRV